MLTVGTLAPFATPDHPSVEAPHSAVMSFVSTPPCRRTRSSSARGRLADICPWPARLCHSWPPAPRSWLAPDATARHCLLLPTRAWPSSVCCHRPAGIRSYFSNDYVMSVLIRAKLSCFACYVIDFAF
jgi:hypothetical protein